MKVMLSQLMKLHDLGIAFSHDRTVGDGSSLDAVIIKREPGGNEIIGTELTDLDTHSRIRVPVSKDVVNQLARAISGKVLVLGWSRQVVVDLRGKEIVPDIEF